MGFWTVETAQVFRQANEPVNPSTGDVWIDTDNGILSTFDGTNWVEQSAGAQGSARENLSMNAAANALAYTASLQSLMIAQGDMVQASSANTPARLALGTALQQLRVNAGATALEYAAAGGVTFQAAYPTSITNGDLHFNTIINRLLVGRTAPNRWIEAEADIDHYYTDPFTSDFWTDVGSGFLVDTTGQTIDFNANPGSADNGCYYDLGGNISDTAWVLRFALTIDAAAFVSGTNWFFIGLSDVISSSRTNQDAIVLAAVISSGPILEYRIIDANAGVLPAGGDATFAHAIAVETIYVQIIRTGATAYTIELFSDATFTTSIELETGTVSSGTINLRYIKVQNDSAQTGGNTINGTIDDIEFYDGVTSV